MFRTLAALRSFVRAWLFRSQMERDMDREMGFHVDERMADLEAQGMPRDKALGRARDEFGDVVRWKEAGREARGLRVVDELSTDVRYGLRTMCRSPGFTAAAVVTLALGVGVTTAISSIVYGVLMRPLPYPAADRLVRLWEEHPGGMSPAGNRWLSNHTYAAWVTDPRTLEGIGAYATYEYTVRLGDEPVRVVGAAVSPSVFTLLKATPQAGRFFADNEGGAGGEKVVVLSDQLWRDRLGAATTAVGGQLTIDDQPHTIVGIAQPNLRFPDERSRLWVAQAIPPVSPDTTRPFTALARLRGGVALSQTEAEGTALARSVPRPAPSTELFFGKGGAPIVHARRLADDLTRSVRPALLVMTVAVTLILLMSCANVANLLLSRGIVRQRELAIRAAIGGSRGRLLRQLFTENAVLSAIGGGLGIIVAVALIRVIPLVAPDRFPRLDDIKADVVMMIVAATASVVTAVIFGLVPAIWGSGLDVAAAMRGGQEASRGRVRGPRGLRLRQTVLVFEAAFTIVLLVSAGLLTRSFVRLLNVDGGYRAEHLLSARIHLPRSAPPEQMSALIDTVLARLRAISGVTAAGAGNMMPLTSNTAITTFPVQRTPGTPALIARCTTYIVTPGYAEALGLHVKEGRAFAEEDTWPGTRKMLVNEEFVRQYLAGPVIGRQFVDLNPFVNLNPDDKGTRTEIVGVVANVLKDGNDREPQPEIYFVHGSPARRIQFAVNVLIRGAGDMAGLTPVVRDLVRQTDSAAVIEHVTPLAALVSRSVDQPRFSVMVLATFATLALALASVGLYGVISYSVAQRRRELAIRAAVGARRRDLLTQVLREGLSVTAVGIGVGLVLAFWLTQFMRAMLFGVSARDSVTFVFAPLLLIGVAFVACTRPALRAASTNPVIALRGD